MTNPQVVFRAEVLTHYREAFHELVRAKLADRGVEYILKVGRPRGAEAAKQDIIELEWTSAMRSIGFGPRKRLLWQFGFSDLGADLLIIGQENRIISNYPIQLLRRLAHAKIAFFGHGRNFQSRNPDGRAERWKRKWATKVDWWFGYTQETKAHLVAAGFPADRITVFENAVDTTEVRRLANAVSTDALAHRRATLGIEGGNTAVFVGGLYQDKRLDFLIAAARQVRSRVPDFELIIVGGGVDFERLKALVAEDEWIKLTGPLFGAEKVETMSLASLWLMPGLVGLGLLDAAACGLPTVTTAFPYHSPEIAYLEDGMNGVIVKEWEDPAAYATAVVDLIQNPAVLSRMQAQARRTAERYTIENMAGRFTQGVLEALSPQS